MGFFRQGVIWIYWGTPTPNAQVQVTPIGSLKSNGYFGRSLTGGADVSGDGTPDLLAGYNNYRAEGNTKGAVWLISGAYINTMPRWDLNNGLTPMTATVQAHVPDDAINYSLIGDQAGGEFGYSVALVPSPNAGEPHWAAIGSRHGSTNAYSVGGKAEVFRWENGRGFNPNPTVIMTNESGGKATHLGHTIEGGVNQSSLLVGSLYSYSLGFAQGAAYAAPLYPTLEP
jgi:hypothetical protein